MRYFQEIVEVIRYGEKCIKLSRFSLITFIDEITIE